jgi:diaminopimelate epimerase
MIPFAKAHAYGNDFLYVERRDVDGLDLPILTQAMCDRHAGIGADGLIIFARTPNGASMVLFNADGGRAEVSGNGVRALGALLAQHARGDVQLTIETEGGVKQLTRTAVDGSRQTFRAAMGQPRDLRRARIDAAGESVDLVVLNMGNPQAILLEPWPSDERFNRLGPAIERHAFFPEGTNVEFVEVRTPADVRIRIWERGVGPTTSSGTGSCGSLVAAAAYGGASRDANVTSPGGAQRVEWRDDSVYLTGWAEVICEGRWCR